MNSTEQLTSSDRGAPVAGGADAEVGRFVRNSVAQHLAYDRAGDLTELSYATVPADGAEAQDILAWTMTSDVQGRTSSITSTSGTGENGLGRTRQFSYDGADRLLKVDDTIGQTCTTRTYQFDTRGNRKSLTTDTRTAGEEPLKPEIQRLDIGEYGSRVDIAVVVKNKRGKEIHSRRLITTKSRGGR